MSHATWGPKPALLLKSRLLSLFATTAEDQQEQPQDSAQRSAFDPLAMFCENDLMIELTSTCNLRCVYCPKSQPGDKLLPGRDQDMPELIRQRALAHCRWLADQGIELKLILSGTGETTSLKGWMDRVQPFLELPGVISIVSNFARRFSEAELATLSRFTTIMISLDTVDRGVLKDLRRKMELEIFTLNVVRLRSVSLAAGTRSPYLHLNCTATSRVAQKFYDLACYAATLDLSLGVSSLYELSPIPGLPVACVTDLPEAEFLDFCRQLEKAHGLFKHKNLAFDVQPDLLDRLVKRLSRIGDEQTNWDSGSQRRWTRLCTQPWQRCTVGADGLVFPCCVTMRQEGIGSLKDQSLTEILSGEKAREFRRGLLSGELSKSCVGCSMARPGEVTELRSIIEGLWQESGLDQQHVGVLG